LSDAENIKPIDKNASQALQRFREAVRGLVERPAGGPLPFEAKLSSEDLARFESLVGKYAGLLPALELPSNAALSATALLGAVALQAGRIKVADHIYEEVNFRASNVTALAYVMQGVLQFVGAMLVLSPAVVSYSLCGRRYQIQARLLPSAVIDVPSAVIDVGVRESFNWHCFWLFWRRGEFASAIARL
jgi:hypothetical protein